MDFATVLSVVLGVLTMISVVASAVAVARASLAKSTIETLQQSNAALTERVDILVSDKAETTARLSALEGENKLLRSLKSGSDAVETVGNAVAQADDRRRQEHHDILAAIQANSVMYTVSHEEAMALIRSVEKAMHTHSRAT